MTKTARGIYGIARRLPLIIGLSATGWIAYSAVRTRDQIPLPDPLGSDLRMIETPTSGQIALHESANRHQEVEKPPVLLVHAVNAAASSVEMLPLFHHVEPHRHTIAMDLPGFAHSERGRRQYTPELMANAIVSTLDSIGRPCHVVALSLGAEFAARAAGTRPDLVQSLTLISPTGMGSKVRNESETDSVFDRLLDIGLVAQAMFDLLVTEASINYFLSKSFVGEVDPALSGFAVVSGKQTGARHAPVAFLQGELFTADALDALYRPLTVPTLVLYDRDAYTDFALLPEFVSGGGPMRRAERIPGTNGLPQFDRPDATVAAIFKFWKEVEEDITA